MHRNTLNPIALEDCNVPQLIHFLVNCHAAPTNLIICSSREIFLQDLLDELNNPPTTAAPASDQEQRQDDDTRTPSEKHSANASSSLDALLLPTLAILSASSTITVSFCPDLTHLLAHLSLLQSTNASPQPNLTPGNSRSDARPILAILNPIRLHRPTSSFSAQGFNRTFASAVECARRRGQQLVLADMSADAAVVCRIDGDGLMQDDRHLDVGAERQGHLGRRAESPWDEQLSMLNVTTKTFGVGERGWVGRTVTVRQVAGRWCRFVRLEGKRELPA